MVELHDGDQIEIGPVERGGILIEFQVVQEDMLRDSEYPSPSFGNEADDIVDRETKSF